MVIDPPMSKGLHQRPQEYDPSVCSEPHRFFTLMITLKCHCISALSQTDDRVELKRLALDRLVQQFGEPCLVSAPACNLSHMSETPELPPLPRNVCLRDSSHTIWHSP